MKFTNGTWDVREGITPYAAVEVTKLDVREDSLRFVSMTRHFRHRGDVLNKPTITSTLSSPLAGVVELHASHFLGKPALKEPRFERFPDFGGAPPKGDEPRVQTTHDAAAQRASLASGPLTATLNTGPDAFNIAFEADGKQLTNVGWNSIQYMVDSLHTSRATEAINATTTTVEPYARPDHAPSATKQPYMAISLGLVPGETFYGLGERFGPFAKNGQAVEMWNEDGGTDSPLGYKNVPFLLSSAGYGVFVDHADWASFEVQSERMDKVQIAVRGETLRLLVIAGPTPKDVLARYTALTGRPPVPPAWSFGLWLTTSFTTEYDEATVSRFVDGLAERQIPLGVFHFDCFWMRGHHWCDFAFDTVAFPDPEGFIGRLKSRGLKVCVWINPYIAQESALFAEGDEEGYFLKRVDGSTWQTDKWQAGMAIVDFTNPAATAWYQGHLTRLLRMGVDSFKTDFGERIPFAGIRYHDGSDPHAAHNYYTHLYNKAVHDAIAAERGPGEACLFARSATAGGQRFPVHWGGDCAALWTGMAESLRGGLSLGLSGFGFHATDIGGFKTAGDRAVAADATLYKRWIQWGLLASHSRLHGSTQYRVPWEVDPADDPSDPLSSSAVLRRAVRLKHRLMPYLLRLAHDAHTRGTPLLRAMLLEFPADRACWGLDLQYMLGDALLVAPVFGGAGARVEFYVPAGRWVGLLDGKAREGPAWHSEAHGIDSLPILVRPGHAVVLAHEEERADFALAEKGFELRVNGAAHGSTVVRAGANAQEEIEVRWQDGEASLAGGQVKGTLVML